MADPTETQDWRTEREKLHAAQLEAADRLADAAKVHCQTGQQFNKLFLALTAYRALRQPREATP